MLNSRLLQVQLKKKPFTAINNFTLPWKKEKERDQIVIIWIGQQMQD